jgi:FkbM family methyltransferase
MGRTLVATPLGNGGLRVWADLATALGLEIYRYGCNDRDLVFVGDLLNPGDVLVDAGANVGLFSLVAAEIVGPPGRVYAFEPRRWCYDLLCRNRSLNDLMWLVTDNRALSERSGVSRFVEFRGTWSGYSSFAPPSGIVSGNLVEVTCVSLDEAIPRDEWSRIRLMKLDVEGSELRVLEGASELVASAHPDILLEVVDEHLARQGASSGMLYEWLVARGYSVYRRADGGRWAACSISDVASLDPERPNVFVTASRKPPDSPCTI